MIVETQVVEQTREVVESQPIIQIVRDADLLFVGGGTTGGLF